MGWTMDQDGNWTSDTPEIDRDEELRREEKARREFEEEFRRRHTPDLQIVPVDSENEEDKPRTPTPDEIQNIIDGLDTPKPKTPYLH